MAVIVEPRDENRMLFERMVQLYSYDFSELNDWAIDADGLFPHMACFDEMWSDPNRFPFLILAASEPAGFALVREVETSSFDMEQFFVMRKFRRAGVGRDAAHQIFRKFSGSWTVEQINQNKAAQIFWRRVISDYTSDAFEESLVPNPVQSFIS